MIKVYFESNNKTELAVIFNDEKTYSCCIKSLIDNQGDKTIKVRASIDNSIGLDQLKPVSVENLQEKSNKTEYPEISLPVNFWDVIENHLPKYHSRQDVADNDTMQKFVDDEFLSPECLIVINGIGEKNVEAYLNVSNTKLYIEALESRISNSEKQQSAINDIVLQNIQALESQKIEAEEKVTKYEELLNTFKSQFIDADNTLWVKMIESVGI